MRSHRQNSQKHQHSSRQQHQAKPAGHGVMLFGFHAVAEAWVNPQRRCHRLWLTSNSAKQFEAVLAEAKKKNLKRPNVEIVEARAIEKLVPQGSVHQGIALEVDNLPEVELEDVMKNGAEASCLVILDQVTDPHNVGAILRSACAFGVDALLVTERNAAAQTGVLAKTASGALEHTPIVKLGNLSQQLKKLQDAGYWCIGLDETGKHALQQIKMPAKIALVLGAEGQGLRRLTMENCDEIAKLPTQPPVGSLNVSNAAAVAIYEVMRQLKA